MAYMRRRTFRRSTSYARRRYTAPRRRATFRRVRRVSRFSRRYINKPNLNSQSQVPTENDFIKQIKANLAPAPSQRNLDILKEQLAIPAIIEKHRQATMPKPLSLAQIGYPIVEPVSEGYNQARLYRGGIWTDPVNGVPTLKEPVEWYSRQQAWLSKTLFNLPELANKKINIYEVSLGNDPILRENVYIDTDVDNKLQGRWIHPNTYLGNLARYTRIGTDDDIGLGNIASKAINAGAMAYGARPMVPGPGNTIRQGPANFQDIATAAALGGGAAAMNMDIDPAIRAMYPQPTPQMRAAAAGIPQSFRPGSPTFTQQTPQAINPAAMGAQDPTLMEQTRAITGELGKVAADKAKHEAKKVADALARTATRVTDWWSNNPAAAKAVNAATAAKIDKNVFSQPTITATIPTTQQPDIIPVPTSIYEKQAPPPQIQDPRRQRTTSSPDDYDMALDPRLDSSNTRFSQQRYNEFKREARKSSFQPIAKVDTFTLPGEHKIIRPKATSAAATGVTNPFDAAFMSGAYNTRGRSREQDPDMDQLIKQMERARARSKSRPPG